MNISTIGTHLEFFYWWNGLSISWCCWLTPYLNITWRWLPYLVAHFFPVICFCSLRESLTLTYYCSHMPALSQSVLLRSSGCCMCLIAPVWTRRPPFSIVCLEQRLWWRHLYLGSVCRTSRHYWSSSSVIWPYTNGFRSNELSCTMWLYCVTEPSMNDEAGERLRKRPTLCRKYHASKRRLWEASRNDGTKQRARSTAALGNYALK